MKTNLIISTVALAAAAALAQSSGGLNSVRQYDTGSIGITAGQTARLNLLYPTIPAPVLQVLCSASMVIADDKNNALKSQDVQRLIAGQSMALDLNADTDLPAGSGRVQIHAFVLTPIVGTSGGAGCNLVPTLELMDTSTGKTTVVVPAHLTWPRTASSTAPSPNPVRKP